MKWTSFSVCVWCLLFLHWGKSTNGMYANMHIYLQRDTCKIRSVILILCMNIYSVCINTCECIYAFLNVVCVKRKEKNHIL